MAIQEKQIRISVNSIIFLFLISCSGKTLQNKPLEEKITITAKSITKIAIDTSVNGLILRDTVSILKNIGDVYPLIIDDFNRGECVVLSNKNKNEFLMMKMENGGYKNQYDYFFLMKNIPKEEMAKMKILSDIKFITNKGAFLGMSEEEFLSKYTDFNFQKNIKADTTKYEYYNEYNVYQSHYIFKDKKLIEIDFGYQD